MKFNNVIEVTKKDKFRYWLEFINPIFGLSNKEITVLAYLLKHYFEIRKKFDEKSANTLLFSTEYRKIVKKDIGISNDNYFDVLLNKLKKHKAVLVSGDYDNRKTELNQKIIPKIDNKGMLNLLILFNDDNT